jgi:putative phosphoribosyl transferase
MGVKVPGLDMSPGWICAECDEVVCLATPEDFVAVGMHYEDFHQVDDSEVQELLQRAPTSV